MTTPKAASPASAIVGLIILVVCAIVVLGQGSGDVPPQAPNQLPPAATTERSWDEMAEPLPPPISVPPATTTGSVSTSSTPPPVAVELEPEVEPEREDDHHPAPTSDEADPKDDTGNDRDGGDSFHWWRWLS